MAQIRPLDIPPEGESGADTDAHELVRFWVASGHDHVTLNIGLFGEAEEPAMWGAVAADIVKHAIHGMMQDVPERDPNVLLAEIERALAKRLASNVDLSGQLRPGTKQ